MPAHHNILPYFRRIGGSCPTFDDWTLDSITAATVSAARHYDAPRAKALAARDAARNQIDAHLLFGKLLTLLDRIDSTPTRWHAFIVDAEANWLAAGTQTPEGTR